VRLVEVPAERAVDERLTAIEEQSGESFGHRVTREDHRDDLAEPDDGSVGTQDGAQVGAKGRGSGAQLMLSIVEPHEEVPETPTIAEAIISAREGTHLESNLASHGEVGDGAPIPNKEAELNLNKEVDLEAATLPDKEASRSHSPNAATAGKALATAPPPLAAHMAARVQGSFRWQPPEVPISGLIAC
jgi:hypothetical protein